MSKTRILSIVPYKVLPAKLGGEKGIALFNEYVGAATDLLCLGVKSNTVSDAMNYTMLPVLSDSRIRYFNPLLYFTVRKHLKQYKATHLLIEHPYYGWLAWLIKKTCKVTWVVHSHNIEFERSKSIGRWWWKILKWYETWVYRSADIIFFISEDDKKFAVTELAIKSSKSHAITYGIEVSGLPTDLDASRGIIKEKYGIADSDKILLFNGALYHHTNYDALNIILQKINPGLIQTGLQYKILVCGKGLPDSFDELKAYKDKNIIYAGFVDDISVYFKAADLFLNPILSGGGVKTKAIEAMAYNCTVISTTIGALGIKRQVCDEKLMVVEDGDWNQFLHLLVQSFHQSADTPPDFYREYYWGGIAERVVSILSR